MSARLLQLLHSDRQEVSLYQFWHVSTCLLYMISRILRFHMKFSDLLKSLCLEEVNLLLYWTICSWCIVLRNTYTFLAFYRTNVSIHLLFLFFQLISLKVQSKNSDFFFFVVCLRGMLVCNSTNRVTHLTIGVKFSAKAAPVCVRLHKVELRHRKAYSIILIHCALFVI